MKKIIFFVLFLICVTNLSACGNMWHKEYIPPTTIHDAEFYISGGYTKKEYYSERNYTNICLDRAGYSASYLFPKYEEIDFNYKDLDFYMFCYAPSSQDQWKFPMATVTLEFSFETKDDYDTLLKKINSQYTFCREIKEDWGNIYKVPIVEFEWGHYFCRVIEPDRSYEITKKIICISEELLTIRYLYIYDESTDGFTSVETFLKPLKEATNAPW